MKKLTIWTETPESAELVAGYLLRLNIKTLYTSTPKLVIADVTDVSELLLTGVMSTILNARGENHLSLD